MNIIKKFASKENGITLIALIVTVVILMILLGASITAFKDIDVKEATNEQINVFYDDKKRMANEVDNLTMELDEKNRVYADSELTYATLTLTCKKDSTIMSNLKVHVYNVGMNDHYNNLTSSYIQSHLSDLTDYALDDPYGNEITDNLKDKLTPKHGFPGQYSAIPLEGSIAQKFDNVISNYSKEALYQYTTNSEGKTIIPSVQCDIYYIKSVKDLEIGGKKYRMKPFLLNIRSTKDVDMGGTYQGYDILPSFEEIT